MNKKRYQGQLPVLKIEGAIMISISIIFDTFYKRHFQLSCNFMGIEVQ